MANISYINNRIISNTGSVYTKDEHIVGDGVNKTMPLYNFRNSFNDLGKYGFSVTPTNVVEEGKIFNIALINTLDDGAPPFEMEYQFTETYIEGTHPLTGPNFLPGKYSVPFSPLNTEYFTWSMELADRIKNINSEGDKDRVSREYGIKHPKIGNTTLEYFDDILIEHPYISAGILFASSLPVNSSKVMDYLISDFKLPGFKQIPYTLALWLGSKWHYYKNHVDIKFDKSITKTGNNSGSKKTNIDNISDYTKPVALFKETIIGVGEINKSDGKYKVYDINTNKSVDYGIYRNHVHSEDRNNDYAYYELNQLPIEYLTNQRSYATDYDDIENMNLEGGNINPFLNSYNLPTYTKPTKILSSSSDSGIGINLPEIKNTYTLLEDAKLVTEKTSDLFDAGIINNIKHYEFGNTNIGFESYEGNGVIGGKPINSKSLIDEISDQQAKSISDYTIDGGSGTPIPVQYFVNLDLAVSQYIGIEAYGSVLNYSDMGTPTKLDIVSCYLNRTLPTIFPLTFYPKGSDSRTVDINAIYATTFKSDNITLVTREDVLDELTNTNTYNFYNKLKDYIHTNHNISVNNTTTTIYDAVKEVIDNISNTDTIDTLAIHNTIQSKTITVSDDVLIDIISLIGVGVIGNSGYLNITEFTKGMEGLFGSKFTSTHLTTIEADITYLSSKTVTPELVGIKQKYLKANRSYTPEDPTAADTPILWDSDTVRVSYPKLFMDLFHGYLEILNELNRKYSGVISIAINNTTFARLARTKGTTTNITEVATPLNELGNYSGGLNSKAHFVGVTDGFKLLKLTSTRILDRIITEEVNNQISLDKHVMTDGKTFSSKLYPSAGGAINLGYGFNSHIYMDFKLPEITKAKLNNGVNHTGGLVTCLDPRLTLNHWGKHRPHNKTSTDIALINNLKNVRNSGLRYLWYSGPYFGVPVAQLSVEDIIFADNNVVSNLMDDSVLPRTNYEMAFNGSLYKNKSDDDGEYRKHLNAIDIIKYGKLQTVSNMGIYPNNKNISNRLDFDTIVSVIGYDILDQLESVFLDFCKIGNGDDGTQPMTLETTMKLLSRIDNEDLSPIYYNNDYNVDGTSQSHYTKVSASDNTTTELSVEEQIEILKIGQIESNVDRTEYLNDTRLYNSFATDIANKNTIGYLTNIILTNAQHNRAKRVLDTLNDETYDVFIKRNWVHNTKENNLVKFFLDDSVVGQLNVLGNLNTVPTNTTSIKTLYRGYLTSLFDNYESGTNIIGTNATNLSGNSFVNRGYLNSRAIGFIRKMIEVLDGNRGAVNQNRIEHVIMCYIDDIQQNNKFMYLDDSKYYEYIKSSDPNKYVDDIIGDYDLFKILGQFANDAYPITSLVKTIFDNPLSHRDVKGFWDDNTNISFVGANNLNAHIVTYYRLIIEGISKVFEIKENTNIEDLHFNMALVDEIEALVLMTIKSDRSTSLTNLEGAVLKYANNLLVNAKDTMENYTNDYLTSFMGTIKQSQSADEVINKINNKNNLDTLIYSNNIRVKPYYNIKKIHDSWLIVDVNDKERGGKDNYFVTKYGLELDCDGELTFTSAPSNDTNKSAIKSLANTVHYVDRGNNDISDNVFVDIDYVYNYFVDPESTDSELYFDPTILNSSLYTFFGDMAKHHGFVFHALPSFSGLGSTKIDDIRKMFTTYDHLETKSSSPHFIFQYIGDVTSELDTKNSITTDRKSFCLDEDSDIPKDISESEKGVTGFVVQFGEQNQQIFNNIQLDQAEFQNTEEYFTVITDLTKNSNGKGIGNNLFKIYDARSYTATISSMGNMEIEPLMYFYLKNVPLFKGTYWITNVSHNIVANQMTTQFKGVRQPMSTIESNTELILKLDTKVIEQTLGVVGDENINITAINHGTYDPKRLTTLAKTDMSKLNIGNNWDDISIITHEMLVEFEGTSSSQLSKDVLTNLIKNKQLDV